MAKRGASGDPKLSARLRAEGGARNEQTRQHNLSSVLTNLHHSGALTRAELTRRTGLNRSTIGALVAELAEAGLVYETSDPRRAGVGRPSPLVHPSERVAALAVNPDMDAVIVGLLGLGGKVRRRVRLATRRPPSAQQVVRMVQKLLGELSADLAEHTIVGLGVAVPGLVRTEDGVVTLAPHLGWREVPLSAQLAEATGYPTFAGNDANLGLIAETLFGAGRGVSDLVYLNGSTSGIGAGVLVGGRPLWGAQGFAAELGHTLIKSGGQPCHCGKRGCLETEVNRGRLLAVIGEGWLDAEQLERHLTQQGDRALRAEVRRQLGLLGEAIAGFVSVFNPQLLLLGGFLASLDAAMPGRLEEGVDRSCFPPLSQQLSIARAQLGADLLLVGAAELALQPLLSNPVETSA